MTDEERIARRRAHDEDMAEAYREQRKQDDFAEQITRAVNLANDPNFYKSMEERLAIRLQREQDAEDSRTRSRARRAGIGGPVPAYRWPKR